MQANHVTPSPVKVVIVDDHKMIVEMLTEILARLQDYAVAGNAGSSTEAVELCQRVQPDLAILDLRLPGATGLDLFQQLKTRCPKLRVLIFSGNLDDRTIRQAMARGVDGIVSKVSATAELKTGILAVSAGRTYLCSQTSEAIRLMLRTPAPVQPVNAPALSKREETVLRHVAAGLSSKEIAARLGLSHFTINNFRARLCKKTGLHRAVQLTRYAEKLGLVGEPLLGSAHPF